MKKVIIFTVIIFILTSFLACGSSDTAEKINVAKKVAVPKSKSGAAQTYPQLVKSPVYPKSTSFYDRSRIFDNELDEYFKKALDNFSYLSASKLLSSEVKNANYSPVSLYLALSIAGMGARNATQDEILSVLGTSEKDINYLCEQNSRLFKLLYTDNEIGKLKIANSLWLQKSTAFKNDFINKAVKSFYASLYNIDFADKSSSTLMSKWISDNTNGILAPQISYDKNQVMSSINTIYYKDEWTEAFNKDKTKPDTFYLSDGSKVQCDFMNNTFKPHGFTRGEGYSSSALSLKNGGSMIFVLPDKGVSVESLISTPEKVASLFKSQNATLGEVIFQIPKFSYGNALELKDTLKSLGIEAAFAINADFSGITDNTTFTSDIKQETRITDNTVFISNIKQETHVAIDEKGVEAAAYTLIQYSGSVLPKDEVAEMILNRPFIYAILSGDRILFIGMVNNPAEKN